MAENESCHGKVRGYPWGAANALAVHRYMVLHTRERWLGEHMAVAHLRLHNQLVRL